MDVSFHPVDEALLNERVVPYVRGKGSLDDLMPRAVRLAHVHYRANAWGLGLLELSHQETERRRSAQGKGKAVAGPPPVVPEAFDSDLHVWGRPFFITAETPAEVSEAIDRYQAAGPEEVDNIARDMLRRLGPGLEGVVTPQTEGTLPAESDLAQQLRWKIDLFRDAYHAWKRGEQVTAPDGERHDPLELFATDFTLAALEFIARFQPGWMARGHVWPTYLLGEAGLARSGLFAPAYRMLGGLGDELPDLKDALEETITQNYTVGGYVAPASVSPTRELMEANRQALGEPTECHVDVRKIIEALYDAGRRGLAFAEAAEVYSGPMGIMN
jgi:hypothetical protein